MSAVPRWFTGHCRRALWVAVTSSSMGIVSSGCELVVPLDDYVGDRPETAAEAGRDSSEDAVDDETIDSPPRSANGEGSAVAEADGASRRDVSAAVDDASDARTGTSALRDGSSEAAPAPSDARDSASSDGAVRDVNNPTTASDVIHLDDATAQRDSANACTNADCGAPVSPIGCSDGTREAFVDATKFRAIAGCGAMWSAASMRAPRTGVACGNSLGRRCAVPLDACAAGWHVCGDAPYGGADVSAKVTLADCRAQIGEFAAAISDKVCDLCSPEGSGAACCGDRCVDQQGTCIYPGATDWFGVIGGHINLCSDIAAESADQGVMCCRTP